MTILCGETLKQQIYRQAAALTSKNRFATLPPLFSFHLAYSPSEFRDHCYLLTYFPGNPIRLPSKHIGCIHQCLSRGTGLGIWFRYEV